MCGGHSCLSPLIWSLTHEQCSRLRPHRDHKPYGQGAQSKAADKPALSEFERSVRPAPVFLDNDHATSNSRTSASLAPFTTSFCSSLAAAPSPRLRFLPFSSTAPLATCSQARRSSPS